MGPETIITFIKHNGIDIKKASVQEIVKKYNDSQLYFTTKAVKEAVTFLSNQNSIVQFQVGKNYSTNSICDSNCWFPFVIKRRTDKNVWIEYSGTTTRRKIDIWDGVESIKPFGSYSMAPILRATDLKK